MEKIETVRRKLAQLPLPNPLTSFIFLPLLYPHIIMEEIPPSNPRLILLTTLDPNSSSLLGRLSLLIIPSVFSFSGISNHSFSTSSFPLWIKCSQTSPIVKKKKIPQPYFPFLLIQCYSLITLKFVVRVVIHIISHLSPT